MGNQLAKIDLGMNFVFLSESGIVGIWSKCLPNQGQSCNQAAAEKIAYK
jgi:hypothetical protein